MKNSIVIIFAIACIFTVTREVHAVKTKPVQRFAVIIGSNDGGPKRVKLKYALKDANAVSKIFKELGGLSKENEIILYEPGPKELMHAFRKLDGLIMKNKKQTHRSEAIFYYSGHSDEKGLLLGKHRVKYRDLKNHIKNLSSDVKVAIIDSCSSGVLVRLKGGERMQPFLLDTSIDTTGYAIVSSSSETEAAQESDRIKGSFFTHYFIAGLRGAADLDNDSRVTFNEAYQYAFIETLSTTKDSRSGPQHPGYDIQMKGAGDLILTDIHKASSGLEIDKDVTGRLYIYNDKENYIIELNKKYDPVKLGLNPGEYEITWDKSGDYYQAMIELEENKYSEIDKGNFFIIENIPDFLEKKPALKPSIATLYAQPYYSVIYGDIADRLNPGIGLQFTGFLPIENSYIYPAALIGFQANYEDRLFIFYNAVGMFYSLNLQYKFNFSASFLFGFADGTMDLKQAEDSKKKNIDFFQPLVTANVNLNYNISRNYHISLSLQAKYFVDPEIVFGMYDVMIGMGYRVF